VGAAVEAASRQLNGAVPTTNGAALKMQLQGILGVGHEVGRDSAKDRTDPFDADRSNLLGLRFGGDPQACRIGGEQRLEGEHLRDVAGNRNDRDDTTAEAFGGRIRAVIAHDDCRPALSTRQIYTRGLPELGTAFDASLDASCADPLNSPGVASAHIQRA
jgi:hypothetical protein